MDGGDWCCAVGRSNTSRKCSKVTFHQFPKDKSLRERWTRAVRRKDWVPNNNSRVCSDHFTPDSHDVSVSPRESFGLARAGQRKKLRACAVPTESAYAPRRSRIERGALAKWRRTELVEDALRGTSSSCQVSTADATPSTACEAIDPHNLTLRSTQLASVEPPSDPDNGDLCMSNPAAMDESSSLDGDTGLLLVARINPSRWTVLLIQPLIADSQYRF
ncbi:peroxynitrite isomerase THAP4-like [Ixodes scapularis]|uniref:peroxynitrite isomerase THAP4-like n=1 Tax=Ixodes scapularis TaxID=6945 RepID=UPI001A9E083D|nr:peroxynitrite isomerase THAP4-like [Ixodes scapularis]